MENNRKPLHFFLGANTPQGFVSRFDQLANPAEGWREFVLKGGPGTGKSSLMRKVAEHTAGRCGQIELIHCSSAGYPRNSPISCGNPSRSRRRAARVSSSSSAGIPTGYPAA